MLVALTVLMGSSSAYADTPPKNRGLFVTPIRQYIDVAAGKTSTGSLTVANVTDHSTSVALSVEQFSVADYTYDYRFSAVKENWITFQTSQLQLEPGKSQTITYTIATPKQATPGGHYFTIFASATLNGGPTGSKVRAATVLYATVDGPLQQSSEIKKETIPWVSFGSPIDFSFDVKNTGNTHFFIYTSGKLSGWTAKPASQEVAHILLPGTVRTVTGAITPPLLPGIYTATYGYRTENGQMVNHSARIVYAPPWSLVIPLALGWVAVLFWKRKKRTKKSATIDS